MYVYKPQKDQALRSISGALLSAGITLNMVMFFGLLMSVIAGLITMSGHLYAAILLFV